MLIPHADVVPVRASTLHDDVLHGASCGQETINSPDGLSLLSVAVCAAEERNLRVARETIRQFFIIVVVVLVLIRATTIVVVPVASASGGSKTVT